MKMIKATEAAQIMGFCRSYFHLKVAKGHIPAGKKFGKSRRWPDYLIEAYAIRYWGLDRPLPELTETEYAAIEESLNNARSEV